MNNQTVKIKVTISMSQICYPTDYPSDAINLTWSEVVNPDDLPSKLELVQFDHLVKVAHKLKELKQSSEQNSNLAF